MPINHLITWKARREFSRAMRFEGGKKPSLDPGVTERPRLLYLHVPFCEKLCPYCSFNRMVFDEALCRKYFRALRKEILLYRDRGFAFESIYVGGGTPTILIDELGETLALAGQCFSIREISVETNPNHLTGERMDVLRKSGVKRLSVGIQSFDNRLLMDMGRYDRYGSGEAIAEQVRQILGQFDTVNADMIFNFPSQTAAMLDRDLEILTGLGINQITYYPLMVSDSTRESVRKTLGTVDYAREERYYHRIAAHLIPAYRFSSAWCFSKAASIIDEYIIDYDEYAGLGSGAIGYVNGICYANTFNIAEYISRLDRGEMALMSSREFSLSDRIRYDFVMKLFGLNLNMDDLRRKHGGGVYRHLWPYILAFSAAGALRVRRLDISLTQRGRYQWVIMMREFFIAVNNFRDFCRAGIAA